MNEYAQHVSRAFNQDLSTLRSHVLEMGGLVEAQFLAAMQVYSSGDLSPVDGIIAGDQRVNQLEKTIDDECAQVIAKRQPAASDLRLVLAIIKIVTDLERIGDEATKIARVTRRIHENGAMPPRSNDVRHLADTATRLLRQALDTFSRLDSGSAQEVIRCDAEVDSEFKSVIRQLITYMMEDPRTISTAIDIIWIARAIERIGDHATNIAEQVTFIVEGRDIRHTPKEASA